VASVDLTVFGRCRSCGARLRIFDHRVVAVLRQQGAALPHGPDDDEGAVAEADGAFECPRCGARGRVVNRAVVSSD
jgi:predicted RNA-binding Zn-ribbon protein involved in translation (DUF1610 family)